MSLPFIKLYSSLLKAVKVKDNTGNICVPLSLTDKVLWMYMLSKYLSFKSSGLLYFETQEVIARNTGLSLRSVKSSIQKIKDLSVVECKKAHKEKHVFYTVYTRILSPSECDHLEFQDCTNSTIKISELVK